MHSDLLLPHLQKEVIEIYFALCQYFIATKHEPSGEDLLRLYYYKSLLLTGPTPGLSTHTKLDLEIVASTRDVKHQLLHTYPPELIVRIIDSGIHVFFDKMERYAAIDVRLRSLPGLYAFFTSMSPVITEKLKKTVQQEFSCINDV